MSATVAGAMTDPDALERHSLDIHEPSLEVAELEFSVEVVGGGREQAAGRILDFCQRQVRAGKLRSVKLGEVGDAEASIDPGIDARWQIDVLAEFQAREEQVEQRSSELLHELAVAADQAQLTLNDSDGYLVEI